MNVRVSLRRAADVLAVCLLLFACSDPSRPVQPVVAHLEIVSGNDQTGVVGEELAVPLVARATDRNGAPVASQTVEFSVTSGDGSLTHAATITDEDGLATAHWKLGVDADEVQTVEVRAVGDDTEVGPDVRGIFRAVGMPDAPASIAPTVTSPMSGQAGAALAEPVEIRVTDKYGNVKAGVTVTWVVKAGGGSATPAASVTDAAGRARTKWILGSTLGASHLLHAAADPGLVAEISALVQLPQGAAVTKSGGDGQSGPVSSQLSTPLEVRLVGPGGVPISGAAVDWSAAGSVGQVTPLSTVTNADGRASARVSLGRNVGAHQVFATIGDLPPVAFGVTATACPVGSLSILQGNGQSGIAGTKLGAPLVVRVTDGSGNPIVGAGVTWSGAGSVTPSNTVSNSQGQVSVSWTLGSASGSQTMTAGLGCSSRSFSATARKRVSTITISPSPPSIEVGTSVQLGATLRDEDGVVLSGLPVAWSSSNGSVASISSSGVLTGNAEGAATIRASAEGVTRQFAVAVLVPPPPRDPVASISISPSAPRVKVGATTQLTAMPLDAEGDPVPDASITWSSLTTSLATVTQAGVVRGVAVGDATIRATSEGITRNVTVRVAPNGAPGVPVMIDIIGGNQQTGHAGEELILQLVARVTDSDGNPVPNAFIAWVGHGSPFADVTSTTGQGITRNYWTLGPARGAQRIDLYTYDFATATRGVLLGSFTATATP